MTRLWLGALVALLWGPPLVIVLCALLRDPHDD